MVVAKPESIQQVHCTAMISVPQNQFQSVSRAPQGHQPTARCLSAPPRRRSLSWWPSRPARPNLHTWWFSNTSPAALKLTAPPVSPAYLRLAIVALKPVVETGEEWMRVLGLSNVSWRRMKEARGRDPGGFRKERTANFKYGLYRDFVEFNPSSTII